MRASNNRIAFAESSHNLLSLGLLQGIAPARRAEACVHADARSPESADFPREA
jgi:hypothetical protein